jgi:hypothetical protein
MRSLFDEQQRREAAARAEAEELRERIAQLGERLAGAEERLSRLVIAREVVDEVLDNGTVVEAPPAAVPEGVTVPAEPGLLRPHWPDAPAFDVLMLPLPLRPASAARKAMAAGTSSPGSGRSSS